MFGGAVHTKGSTNWRHSNGYQNKRVPKHQVFQTQKTCHFDTPFVLIPLWALQKTPPNGYQSKRVSKCLVFRNQKTCHFDTQRKDFLSDVSSNAVLMRHQMQNFFGELCCGCGWAVRENDTPSLFWYPFGFCWTKKRLTSACAWEQTQVTLQQKYSGQECNAPSVTATRPSKCSMSAAALRLFL